MINKIKKRVTMRRFGLLILVLFFIITIYLSGCTETPEETHGLDMRLVGEWQNQKISSDILTFYGDGTYTVAEGEMANWSTASGGKLWMYGTLYAYAISENGTILTLTQESFTKTYRRL
jgi:hypothetical protein